MTWFILAMFLFFLKTMNFKMFDKVCVLITGFEGGVPKCPPKVGEVLFLGGEEGDRKISG